LTHPVQLVVTDDLRRSRLTVLFRAVLAVPHLVWATLWTCAIALFVPFQWVWAIFAGGLEQDVHAFLTRFVRYRVHLDAYLLLLANPWPPFNGHPGYPVDLETAAPERQRRVALIFRPLLAIPAAVFSSVLGVAAALLAFFGWFAALARGRLPEGMAELGAYCLRYQTQTFAYVLLLTSRYPTLASGATASR
jgi:uncharacterized protein DUF4389